mmetsp:Transcript_5564/g.21766  ORF Transcript_5564/g.21766 Transcript_5564/m.21766 type:complete len:285 (-) Transcript_5564:136-990(-)
MRFRRSPSASSSPRSSRIAGYSGEHTYMTAHMATMVTSKPSVPNIPRTTLASLDVYTASKNPFLASNNPSPTCMPCTTASGVTLLNVSINLVVPSTNTMEDTNKPATIISLTFNGDSPNATAAIVFIGCTGMGISYRNAVSTLYNPVNTIVVPASTPHSIDIPTSSGKKVPRSPSAPLASRQPNSRQNFSARAPTTAAVPPTRPLVARSSDAVVSPRFSRAPASTTRASSSSSAMRISYSPADVIARGRRDLSRPAKSAFSRGCSTRARRRARGCARNARGDRV